MEGAAVTITYNKNDGDAKTTRKMVEDKAGSVSSCGAMCVIRSSANRS
jgi:hypothetical protein